MVVTTVDNSRGIERMYYRGSWTYYKDSFIYSSRGTMSTP